MHITEMESSNSAFTVEDLYSNANVLADINFGEQSGSNHVVTLDTVETWNAEKNLRFKELARAESIRDLSVDELVELDDLSEMRRVARYPRTADEILWQRRQQKLTNKLLGALKDYVDFHKGTNNP